MTLDDNDEFVDHVGDVIERAARYYNITSERMTEIHSESYREVSALMNPILFSGQVLDKARLEELTRVVDKFYYERYGLKHVRT